MKIFSIIFIALLLISEGVAKPYNPDRIIQNAPFYAKVEINEKRASTFGVKNSLDLTLKSYDKYIQEYTNCLEYDIVGVSSVGYSYRFKEDTTTHYIWIKCLKN